MLPPFHFGPEPIGRAVQARTEPLQASFQILYDSSDVALLCDSEYYGVTYDAHRYSKGQERGSICSHSLMILHRGAGDEWVLETSG